jgi:hypothetical protein
MLPTVVGDLTDLPDLPVGGLEDSTPWLHDPTALRRRIDDCGHLFLRALLPRDEVLAVRAAILDRLAPLGWLAPGSDPAAARPGTPRVFGDPDWWGGYAAIQSIEAYHRLAHAPEVVAVARMLAGEDLLVQPMKIARVTFPGNQYPTPPHQDFYFVRGSTATYTAWVPLGDCPRTLGGLCIVPGSHRRGLRDVSPASGAGGITAHTDAHDTQALTADYRAGDVLLFHSLAVHWAPSNRGDQLRLSADYRYQSCADPVVLGALLPHEHQNGVPGWAELSRGWETTRWVEPPAPVSIAPLRST